MRKSRNPLNDSRFDLQLILNLENEGNNLTQISKIIGINKNTLEYRLKKLKVVLKTCRDRYRKNHTYFDNIDDEFKSYFLGFIIADGCIRLERTKSNNNTFVKTLTFCNSIDDIQILQILQEKVCSFIPLKYIKGIDKKDQIRFSLTSSYLVDCLINNYNIKPNKTLDSGFKFPLEKIEKHLVRHFIRGYFDGDGTICNYSKQKTKRLGFVFTSDIFMKQVNDILIENIPNINIYIQRRVGKTVDYYITNISLGGEKLQNVYDYLYKDANIFLSRKRDKFLYKIPC